MVWSQTLVGLRGVQDSKASMYGGLTMAADGSSIDLGNNTNWTFGSGDYYWVASAPGNWSDPNNWSLCSGCAVSGGVPTSTHTVVFDGGGVAVSFGTRAVGNGTPIRKSDRARV
jgi:hypothetical protein